MDAGEKHGELTVVITALSEERGQGAESHFKGLPAQSSDLSKARI